MGSLEVNHADRPPDAEVKGLGRSPQVAVPLAEEWVGKQRGLWEGGKGEGEVKGGRG